MAESSTKPPKPATGSSTFYAQSVGDISQTGSQSTVKTRVTRTTIPHNPDNPPVPKELASLQTINPYSFPPPPPTPVYPSTGSPSTRYSESPGIWSRTSTPTSLSSYSPGIVQPAKGDHRHRQMSPTQIRPSLLPHMSPSPVSDKLEARSPNPQSFAGPMNRSPRISQDSPEEGVARTKAATELPRSPPLRQSSRNFQSKGHDNPFAQLDHISVDSASSPPNPGLPPRRPSREGTEKLDVDPSPVVQSNLTALQTTGHKRRESADRSQTSGVSHPTLAASAGLSEASEPAKRPGRTLTKSPKKVHEEASSSFPGRRFGIFSKKSTPDIKTPASVSTEKPPRKGPVAGTGHEGYGKYAQRGRKASIGSSSSTRARSTSTSTSAGGRSTSSGKGNLHGRPDLEIDNFLLDRLEPVIISGGGGLDHLELVRTKSNQSASSLSSTVSTAAQMEPAFAGYSSDSLISSVDPLSQPAHSRYLTANRLLPQKASSKISSPNVSRNGSFQSLQDLGVDKSKPTTRPSRPNNTTANGTESNLSALPRIATDGRILEAHSTPRSSKPSTKADKKPKGMRWNFFLRSRTAEQRGPEPTLIPKSTAPLHAAVSTVSGSRVVAHYALLDVDSDSLEEILHRVEDSPPSNDGEESIDENAVGLGLHSQRGVSVLLPSPPAFTPEFSNSHKGRPMSPKVYFSRDVEEFKKSNNETRPSRLTSVGRIPQVVSRRDGEHKTSNQSFSRPFSQSEAPSFTVTANTQPSNYYSSARPQLDIQTDILPSRPFYSNTDDTPKPVSAPVVGNEIAFPSYPSYIDEFLKFSPRKGSLVSSSTSESDSIMAVVKAMGPSLDAKIVEEDIWAEYDDLLDRVASPEIVGPLNDATPELGGSFELATKASKTLQAELKASDEMRDTSDIPDTPSVIPPLSGRSSDGSFRLRRSQIMAALNSPSSQTSYSELIAGYGERNKSNPDLPHFDTSSVGTIIEDQSPDSLPSLPPLQTDFESARRRNTLLFDMAERDREGAIVQTNLRSASLMMSRWLSFGRVLFSPAHNHITTGDQRRILVIDGLGNDDWSFYCALTYPNATIYSLAIGSDASPSPNPGAWDPPTNHHLVNHPSVNAVFPFPKGFFTACVLRFPAASSEMGQRNIVSECKRVLRPGGYLEMSILDLDLVNMGSRTRKAVRMLKERTCLTDASISLKPASDNIQRLLGLCGYDNLNRCMVGLPVARTVVGSTDSSGSNESTQRPTPTTSASESTTDSSQANGSKSAAEAEMSLGDLLSDPSPSASNDESIAKMVARVGRWWYTRCHEIPVIADGDLDCSIFADHRLLHECQKMNTGFRLLIGYAQKPSEKRRTVSV
jgi:hypothetical protein